MKHILLFVFLLSLGFNSIAQIEITPDVETQDTILNLTDEWTTTKMKADLYNNGSEDAVLRWEIFKIDGPADWQVQLCVDANYGGCFAWDVNSNISDDWGTDVPLIVTGGGGSSIWQFAVRPNLTPGCGTYEIRVTDTADVNTVLATSTHTFRVNVDANCEATSVSELDKKSLKVFPNPTTDYFTLTENDFVREIQIFNIVGKRMATTPFFNGQAINVSSYPIGLYLIKIMDKDGDIVKTTRLTKR